MKQKREKQITNKYLDSDPKFLDTTSWPKVLDENLSEKSRGIFLKRKQAVEMYLSDLHTLEGIFEETGIRKHEVYLFVKRCLSFDENNEIYGYRALIPFKRIKKYSRNAATNGIVVKDDSNFSGAFNKLLEDYPEIKEWIINNYIGKKKGVKEPIIKVKHLHENFIKLCRSLGIDETKGEYPFNTSDLGNRALYRFIEDYKKSNPSKVIKHFGNDAKVQFNTTGIGEKLDAITRPYQRVELDGHKIDALMTVKVTTPDGDVVPRVMQRIWVLVVIDVATRAILGYHVSLKSEYDSEDVLECIENAVLPWKKRDFVINGLEYPKFGGFPSGCIPEAEYAVWDEIALDNAMSHRAKNVWEKLKNTVGCSVNFGPAGTPTRRPFVEKMFHLLETNGFHRLPSTTGSHSKDPKRQNADANAIRYEITTEEIEDLVEVLLYGMNGESKSALYGMTPLEAMRQRIDNGAIPRTIQKDSNLFYFTFKRKVSGSIESGKRPYITYEGVKYRNDVISSSYMLAGKTLSFQVNLKDLRTVRAFLPDGSELGILVAEGKWGIYPHSLKTRRLINKKIRNKEIYVSDYHNPIDVYTKHLNEKSNESKKERNKLAYIKRELKRDEKTTEDINNEIKHAVNSEILKVTTNQKAVQKSYLSDELKQLRKNRLGFNK